jgi:hypothetical protein
LPRLYNDVFLKVKGIVSSTPFLSFTTDAWESKDHRHCILSLTCHFLDKDFEPKFYVLDAMAIKGFFYNFKNI